ncbi:MAG: hypothetical protein ACLFQS_07070 [Bacteroidales bacterium]
MLIKKLFTGILLSIITLFVYAHNENETQQNETVDYTGTILVNGGFSLGYYNYGFLGSRSISVPPITGVIEYGVHEFITAGVFAGYGRWTYDYLSGSSYSWSFINAGARGSVHITRFFNEVFDQDIDEEKIDWYVSLLGGLEIRGYNSTLYPDLYDNKTRVFLGPISGVRYYLGNNFSIYLEGGRGALGYLTFGVSAKI